LRQIQTIALPGVNGRIDHMAVDVNGQRLLMSALGNNTLEVIDLKSGRRVHTIRGLKEPQGAAYIPEEDEAFVANARGGAVVGYDGKSLKELKTYDFTDDADNLRYDRLLRRLYVGYGGGALGIIDLLNRKTLPPIKLAGHPESFQIEVTGSRIFVNVPTAHHIAVIDRYQATLLATWPVNGARDNFPMALDETHHRLLITTRQPPKLIAFDTDAGKSVASLPTVGDADDMFYDAARSLVYISGGAGAIDVFRQSDPDHYEHVARIPTAPGARTSLFVPALKRLYLAVPHRPNQPASIRVYEASEDRQGSTTGNVPPIRPLLPARFLPHVLLTR
jgi:hypothetical protein